MPKDPAVEPLGSLYNTVVFSARDWSRDAQDAWIYGIVVGWNKASVKELTKTFGWDSEAVERLTRLRDKFAELHVVEGMRNAHS